MISEHLRYPPRELRVILQYVHAARCGLDRAYNRPDPIPGDTEDAQMRGFVPPRRMPLAGTPSTDISLSIPFPVCQVSNMS